MKKKLNLAALLLAAALLGACGGQKQDAADTVAQTESAETENVEQKSSIDLADGVYTVDFKTDSSTFIILFFYVYYFNVYFISFAEIPRAFMSE